MTDSRSSNCFLFRNVWKAMYEQLEPRMMSPIVHCPIYLQHAASPMHACLHRTRPAPVVLHIWLWPADPSAPGDLSDSSDPFGPMTPPRAAARAR